jgi:hypothetical protein
VLARLFAVACLAGSAFAQGAEPEFVAGELTDLACSVSRVGGTSEYAAWLVVEVRNRGAAAAEPLAFRIELPAAQRGAPARVETFQRTLQPRTRRFGRPVPAGAAESYWISTSLLGKRGQYRVTVEAACWHRGSRVEAPALVSGVPEQVQRSSMAGTFPVTLVQLENPFDHDVDALFLVTLKQPLDAVELYGVRVPARGRRAWEITTRPPPSAYVEDGTPPGCAMKAVRFELVDWCLAAPADPAAGTALFAPAYAAWQGWAPPFPEVTGSFTYTERIRRLNSEEYDEREVGGRFTLHERGGVTVEIQRGQGANPEPWIAAAFDDLRRKDLAALQKSNVLTDLGSGCVALRGPGFREPSSSGARVAGGSESAGAGAGPWYRVEGGRIVASGEGERLQEVWETRELGRGYVVVSRRSPDRSNVETIAYGELDGRIVPRAWVQLFQPGGNLHSRRELVLSELAIDARDAVRPAPPVGPGAEALRAAWEQGYRYPTAPLEITGEVEVVTPGTDLVWLGRKRVEGRVTMRGLGRSCRELELEVAGDAGPETQRALAGVLYDRLLLWYGRDPNDRQDFNAWFQGATIAAPNAQGEYRVANGPVEAVVVSEGRIAALVLHGGMRRTFGYARSGDRQAATAIATGEELVRITLAEVDGHLVPVKLRFERVFGRDWGPETITFRNLRIR